MIIVGLHSIHGIDSNTPEGAGAHPKEGGLRPTRHGGGGVGQLNSMSLTPARSTPVQVQVSDDVDFVELWSTDFNDNICRYIVYIIYRSSCLSRTTRLVGDIAIFQQYVLVI